jgi:hypothetical protein
MGPESEGRSPPEPDNMSIHEKIRVCNEMYWHLQTAVLGMQTSMEWAFQVLPESDLRVVALNMQALQNQLQQIEAYSDALQVNQNFQVFDEFICISQTVIAWVEILKLTKICVSTQVVINSSKSLHSKGCKSPSK